MNKNDRKWAPSAQKAASSATRFQQVQVPLLIDVADAVHVKVVAKFSFLNCRRAHPG